MKWLILFGITVKFVVQLTEASDSISTASFYCGLPNNNCPLNTEPLACSFTNSTAVWCDGEIYELSQADILVLHNRFRQKIANDGLDGKYPTASRMNRLLWDQELEQLALYNAKRCKLEHDFCVATYRLKNTGQNIGMQSWSGKHYDIDERVRHIINEWFRESDKCDKNCILSYYQEENPAVENFVQMIKDKVTYIGCAAITFREYSNGNMVTNIYVVCNYSYGLKYDKTPYNPGAPGSQCQIPSYYYPGLCSD